MSLKMSLKIGKKAKYASEVPAESVQTEGFDPDSTNRLGKLAEFMKVGKRLVASGEHVKVHSTILPLPKRGVVTRKVRGLLKVGGDGSAKKERRFAEILEAAKGLFEGDEEKAKNWLDHPVRGLGGKRPVDLLETSAGSDSVIGLIERLERGIFV